MSWNHRKPIHKERKTRKIHPPGKTYLDGKRYLRLQKQKE